MIALIDYKAGNLTSVRKALAALGADVLTPETPADLRRVRGIIVPGVGHFLATRVLQPEWAETIRELVREGRPLLGICLGMQWLFQSSEEAPDINGLGVLDGQCYRLGRVEPSASTAPRVVKIPHVGWNRLALCRSNAPIVEGVANDSQVYFTHSYVAPVTRDTVATTAHGEAFASIVQRGNIAGVQFHPEKSGQVGLQILGNWLRSAA